MIAAVMAALMASAGLALATGTHAPAPSHPVTRDFAAFLESAQNILKPVLFRSATTEACRDFYQDLHDGTTLDVRIALGYMDAPADEGPIVVEGIDYGLNYALDGHARTAFTSWIQRPCVESVQLCGFRADPEDPDLYLKAPDAEAGLHRGVRLRVTHASAAPLYARNIEGGDSYELQNQLTHRGEANFLGGLGEADAVFYLGHARGGGGPDFAPPVLRADRHVNYDGYYRRVKPGVKKLVRFLETARRPAKVICLLSCKAKGLFVEELGLGGLAPRSMFVTAPALTGYKTVLLTTIVVFDSLLNRRCLSEIRAMLDRVETLTEVGGEPLPLSEIIHFDGLAPVN